MRLRSLLPFIATLAILATWLIFTDARGIANFQADQSLAGLMARRALAGEFTPYVWGQRYFGTLFLIFSMPVEALWPGNIFLLRLPFVLMQIVSVALWLIYVHRHCGRTVTIITGMILAVPSLPALDFLYFHLSSLYLILFFTSLLLLSNVDNMTFRSTVRIFLVGICWGLGLWTTPVFILLIGITCFCMVLQSESWRVLRANCIGMIRLKQREGNLLITFATLTVLLALFLLVFSQYSGKRSLFVSGIVMYCTAAFVTFFIVFSLRSLRSLRAQAIALIGGFVIGYFPALWAMFSHGVQTDSQMFFRYADPQFVPLFFGKMVPGVISVNGPYLWSHFMVMPALLIGMLVVFVCMIASLCFALWLQRGVMMRALSLQHINGNESFLLFVTLLFLTPLIALFFREGHDSTQIRYVLESIPAGAALIAIGLHDRMRSWGLPYVIVMTLLFALLLIVNITVAKHTWGNGNQRFSAKHLAEVTTFLEEQNVRGGYADYWMAFPIDFLLSERFIFAPFMGDDRYPPYSKAVAGMRRFAFIRQGFDVKEESTKGLINGMHDAGMIGKSWFFIGDRLDHLMFVTRHQTQFWDIWILEDRDVLQEE